MNITSKKNIHNKIVNAINSLSEFAVPDGALCLIGYQRSQNYNDIFWWRLKLKHPIDGYTHIHLLPYSIKECDVYDYVPGAVRANGHADADRFGTGCIHPSKMRVAVDVVSEKIKTIVLVSNSNKTHQMGPALPIGRKLASTEFAYEFGGAVVPGANYYPMIQNHVIGSSGKRKQTALCKIADILRRSNVMD